MSKEIKPVLISTCLMECGINNVYGGSNGTGNNNPERNNINRDLWCLRNQLCYLRSYHPNQTTKFEHTYRIPTPTFNFKGSSTIARANLDKYKNISTFSIMRRDIGYEKTDKLTNLLTGKKRKEIPELLVATVRTQFSKEKVFSTSMHFVGRGSVIPTHLYYAIHPPNYDWGEKWPRGRVLKEITDNDLSVFFDAINSAKYYQLMR